VGQCSGKYEFITKNMDWITAARYCHSRGASLAIIEDKYRQSKMNSLLSQISGTCLYLLVCLSLGNQKAELPQRWPRDAPWKFSGYFSRNFQQAFVPIDPMNVRTKLTFVSLPVS